MKNKNLKQTHQIIISISLLTAFGLSSCQSIERLTDPASPLSGPIGSKSTRALAADICDYGKFDKTQNKFVTILQNDGDKLELSLGEGFSSVFNTQPQDLLVELVKEYTLDTNEEYSKPQAKEIIVEKTNSSNGLYKFNVEQFKINNGKSLTPGAVTIRVYKNGMMSDTLLWQQDVFIKLKADENRLNSSLIQELAEKYAPVLSMTEKEYFHPSSLEYIFQNPDPKLRNENFVVVSEKGKILSQLRYDQLAKALPHLGDKNSTLKIGTENRTISNGANETLLRTLFGKSDTVRRVYYSVIYYNEMRPFGEPTKVIINYHFIYPFDYKNSASPDEPVWAAHAFDRESLSVVLKYDKTAVNANQFQLDSVVYGAHLPTQKMALLNPEASLNPNSLMQEIRMDSQEKRNSKFLQSWINGRVMVGASEIKQFLSVDGRPLGMVAQGSHGMYPAPGTYAVVLADQHNVLTERAGGNQLLVPEKSTFKGTNLYKYKLESLDADHLTACSKNAVLNYSGNFVDVQGGLNANFPPFTGREAQPYKYFEVLRQARSDYGAFDVNILKNPKIKSEIESIKKLLGAPASPASNQ